MTNSLEELARRIVPTYRVPVEGNGRGPEQDPVSRAFQQDAEFAAQELQTARLRSQTARMRAEAEAEEIEALNRRDAAAMERQQIIEARRAQMQPPPPAQGGGAGNQMIEALITLVTETQKDTRDLMTKLTATQNQELKAQLDTTREQLTAAIQRPPEDPVASIAKYMAVFKELQAIAPRNEAATAAAQNVRDIIELEKARNQMEIERLHARRDGETNELERQRLQADIQARQMRDWQFAKALNDAVPQLTAALTARITNTPWNPEPPPPPSGPRAWTCFNCNAQNEDPPDTVVTTCKHCGIEIRLEPIGLGPPAPASEPEPVESAPEPATPPPAPALEPPPPPRRRLDQSWPP
ncbi:MAG TPA: hypothetical protein VMU89_14800 [Thermomicrobiaceae bacterium]|nr:hypothetical protein [Thermomicrobiaceae bacterium]